jgi:cell division protein ZapE
MHGGVGRGKSFLMDCFYNAVPIVRKTRLHFHEFMREVHRELTELQGTVNPLDELGKRMAKRYRLVCFDEFHVADITDAMILHRLLAAMFDNGIGFVTTSNFRPDDLYPNGLHRDRILPAIALLNQQLEVHQRGQRHRLPAPHHGAGQAVPHAPGPRGGRADGRGLHPPGRKPRRRPGAAHRGARHPRAAQGRRGGVVRLQARCAVARARKTTTLKSRRNFHTVLLSDVPQMFVRHASEARRFTWLVDVLYDRRVKLIMSAQVQPEALYTEGPMAHEFPRTISRLNEMQSAEFLALDRRVVDTRLT